MSKKRLVLLEIDEELADIAEEYWQPEFFHFLKVFPPGAKKHGKHSWLKEDGGTMGHKDVHASMFRHTAESSTGHLQDIVSGLHPLLHLQTRAAMCYTRQIRGIKHPDDLKEPT